DTMQLLPHPSGQAPGDFIRAVAYGIDSDGNIAGQVQGNGGGAVLWVPHRTPGDANFDGTVNFTDLRILAANYGQPGGFVDGDFSLDHTVSYSDLLILAEHYGPKPTDAQLAE